MKYTKYFSQIVKAHGSPQLSVDDFKTFMNIVHLEAKIEVYKEINIGHKYSLNIRKIQKSITLLTNDLEPKELVHRWINGDSIRKAVEKIEYLPWDENERYLERPGINERKTSSRRK